MKFFKKIKEIKSKIGETHFIRYAVIESKYFSFYIHYFTKPDKDLFEHDHPWDFFLIVLKGGYKEQSNNIISKISPISCRYIHAEYRHKILELNSKSSISLAFTGKRKREWGYYTDKGWIDNISYRLNKNS